MKLRCCCRRTSRVPSIFSALAIFCVCFTATVTAGVVLICHYHWMLPASMSVLKGHLWLLPVSVFGGGLYQALSYWVMRHDGYRQIATTKLTQAGAQVATQLGAGLVIHGSLGSAPRRCGGPHHW